MSITQKVVHIPFLDFGLQVGQVINQTIAEYQEQGHKPQTQFYGFKFDLKDEKTAVLTFEKTKETPDGSPVLFSFVKNDEAGGCEMSFIILDFGPYQDSVVQKLEGVKIGESVTFEIPLP